MDFESTWNQAQMSFCKMWNRLRSELTKESTRVEIGGVARTEVNKILLDMARIEVEEFNDSVAAMYSATYEKKQYINGDEEYKIANGGKLAREVFEQIPAIRSLTAWKSWKARFGKEKVKPFYLTSGSLSLWMKRWRFRTTYAMKRRRMESGLPCSEWRSFPRMNCRKECSCRKRLLPEDSPDSDSPVGMLKTE